MSRFLSWLGSLAAELKRRRIYHVASVYAVAAWVVLQVAKLLVDALFLPPAALTALLVVVLLGFPVAMVATWLYDLTPEGVERTARARAETAPPTVRRGVLAVLLGTTVLATAAAGWATWRVWLAPAAATGASETEPRAEAPAELDPTRIAVLYFDDHSAARDLGAVARGLTEDLTHELSGAPGLEVVPRNAVKPFRHGEVSLDSLAAALEVGTVVEGSVDRHAGGYRVTVQMADASRGAHIVSEQVETRGGDLLALRDRTVREVARLLRQRLGESVALARTRSATENPDAWRLFHRARELMEYADTLRLSGEAEASGRIYAEADSTLARVEALDPDWLAPRVERGWVRFGQARLVGRGVLSDFPEDTLRDGIAHASRAVDEDRELAASLELRGTLRFFLSQVLDSYEADTTLDRAEEDLRRAVELDEDRAVAWISLARVEEARGRFAEARFALRRSREADPFLAYERDYLFAVAALALDLGQPDTAVRLLEEGRRLHGPNPAYDALELTALASPEAPPVAPESGWALQASVARRFPEERWPQGELLMAAVLVRSGLDDSARDVADRALEAGTDDRFTHAYAANAHLQLGDTAAALGHLERYLEIVPERRPFVANDAWWRGLRDDPRFRNLVSGEGSR
jgi:TolB-like protein/Flp pilus assembly protein TadD